MKVDRTGVHVIFVLPEPSDRPIDANRQLFIYACDRFKCPECGRKVLTDFGRAPVLVRERDPEKFDDYVLRCERAEIRDIIGRPQEIEYCRYE